MKNIKAMSFMEYHSKLFNECEKGEITIQEYYNLMQDAGSFYSQPFKTELITELFEGTKAGRYNGYAYLGKWGECHFKEDSCMFHILTYNSAPPLYLKLPLTLDQFITDCQRAGIELSFSPLAIEKLNLTH